MKPRRPFFLLLKLFEGRFFESDDAAPGSGFQTNITQVLGFLLTSGFVVSYLTTPAISQMMNRTRPSELPHALRAFQLFSPVVTFTVIGFATFFEWDMLFPNRRDFLILTPFPIRARDVFAAQAVALMKFLALLILAVNLFPTVFTILMSFSARFRATGMQVVLGEIAATAGVSAFAFFAITALQGVLMNVTSPRIFRRISPYVQMCGMSLMVLSIVTFPLYSSLLKSAAQQHQPWLWLFPPVWFTGIYDLLLPGTKGLFVSLGIYALRMLAGAIAVFVLTWAIAFHRHYRRTLESEEAPARKRSSAASHFLCDLPQERAILQFTGKTLARSRKHQLFLVTYFSVGLALAVNFVTRVHSGALAISEEGARAFPFLLAFFTVSGFRAVFQFPAELSCNWLFRITESGWGEVSRGVTRKRVLVSGLLPLVLALAPIEIAIWGLWQWPLHTVFQFCAGALLVELMFWTFDKVPFTCSYFPGKTNLSILFVLYFYGYSMYSFNMADAESAIEGRWLYGILFFAIAAAVLAWSWRRRPPAAEIRFDASEPTIQTLNLT